MSALVLTADEKTLLDAVDSLVDDAFADGVEYPAATRILAPLPGYGDPRSRPHLSAIRGPFLAALLALNREAGGGGGSPAAVDHLSLLAPIAYSRARWTPFDTTDLSMYFTTGCAFRPSLAVGVLGVDFWWEGGAASVKVSVWSEDGTRQRTVTVSVAGNGAQYAPFASAWTAPAFQTFTVGVFDLSTSPHHFTSVNSNSPSDPDILAFPRVASGTLMWVNSGYSSGDALPTTIHPNKIFLVQPRFG